LLAAVKDGPVDEETWVVLAHNIFRTSPRYQPIARGVGRGRVYVFRAFRRFISLSQRGIRKRAWRLTRARGGGRLRRGRPAPQRRGMSCAGGILGLFRPRTPGDGPECPGEPRAAGGPSPPLKKHTFQKRKKPARHTSTWRGWSNAQARLRRRDPPSCVPEGDSPLSLQATAQLSRAVVSASAQGGGGPH